MFSRTRLIAATGLVIALILCAIGPGYRATAQEVETHTISPSAGITIIHPAPLTVF